MSNWFAVHAASLRQLQAELGGACPQFTWSGANYLALPGGARRRKDLVEGGWKFDSDMMVSALVSQFPQSNAQALRQAMINTQLQYLGDNYKIKGVTIAPGGLQVRIECEDLYQAAG